MIANGWLSDGQEREIRETAEQARVRLANTMANLEAAEAAFMANPSKYWTMAIRSGRDEETAL